MDPRLLVGRNIARLRAAKNVSQTELASRIDPALLGMDQSYISKVERGEKNVTIVTLAIIAEALQVRLSDLVTED
jgi:transcriptional regulator with XRE-family HTH domain